MFIFIPVKGPDKSYFLSDK